MLTQARIGEHGAVGLALGQQVSGLPADHAPKPRSGGYLGGHLHLYIRCDHRAQQYPQGFGQQTVTGKDRHSRTEHHVVGRQTAAQLVVIHVGEVVVDERIGVNHLQGAGQVDKRFRVGARHFG